MSFPIFYGFFFTSASPLATPIVVSLYFLAGISGWWIVASIPAAEYLFRVTKQGAGMMMIAGAERDEHLYQMLVARGAFHFEPAEAGATARRDRKHATRGITRRARSKARRGKLRARAFGQDARWRAAHYAEG
jgi:hypothetical protein